MRILFVEDNIDLRSLVTGHLASRGFAVDGVGRVQTASSAMGAARYDLVLLDLGLPDGDGSQLIEEARRTSQGFLPVVILTARDGLAERVRLLNLGADDFILKPFDLSELEARIRAVLRRPGARAALGLRCGDLSIEPGNGDLRVGAIRCVDISRRELALLEELMRACERTVVREALEDRLYSFDEAVTPNALEQTVSRLRRRLAEAGSSVVLETKRGIGYRLSASRAAT
ncbi:MAG: response regulator transcription factor [Sphingomonadales bacterium]|nr:MAG: response regulator transcription factor [Sphingomonadales bacterium]